MDEIYVRSAMLLGQEGLERLRASHVAVLGLGGVGSWCAEALGRSGVGELTLIDEDRVSPSNINRQLCATGATVGLPKAEVMARRLREIDPTIKVHPLAARYEAATGEALLGTKYDFLVDAIDLVSCKLDLILRCREKGIPMISALGTGNKLDAQRLEIADLAETRGCPLARVMRRELKRLGVLHHPVVYSPEEPRAPRIQEDPPPGRRSVPGSLVWVPASAGLLLCQYVVENLAGEK